MKESSRRLLGGEPEEKTPLQEMEEAVCSVCPSLSWRNRLIGYGACLAAGFLLTFGSMFRSVVWFGFHFVYAVSLFVGTLTPPLVVNTAKQWGRYLSAVSRKKHGSAEVGMG